MRMAASATCHCHRGSVASGPIQEHPAGANVDMTALISDTIQSNHLFISIVIVAERPCATKQGSFQRRCEQCLREHGGISCAPTELLLVQLGLCGASNDLPCPVRGVEEEERGSLSMTCTVRVRTTRATV
jgi:hypothetical protein